MGSAGTGTIGLRTDVAEAAGARDRPASDRRPVPGAISLAQPCMRGPARRRRGGSVSGTKFGKSPLFRQVGEISAEHARYRAPMRGPSLPFSAPDCGRHAGREAMASRGDLRRPRRKAASRAAGHSRQPIPGMMRRMKWSNKGTVKAVSPRAALQTMPLAIN